MTGQERIDGRLLFRVDPIPLESPRGYLCRVAEAHGYDSAQWLTHLAGFTGPEAAIEREDRAQRIAHLLRLEPEEWLAMCYRQVKGPHPSQRFFWGKPVSAYHFNFGKPRVCPSCLRKQAVWWAVWDLCLVAACPIHRCLLLDQCLGCKKTLTCHRPAPHKCQCGLDLRTLITDTVDIDLVAINAVIYRAAGMSPSIGLEEEINHYGLPPELAGLTLDSLLVLLGCAGKFGQGDIRRSGRRSFARTDLHVAVQVGRTAASILRNWPHQLRAALKGMIPESIEDASALRFHEIFGAFYFRLFRGLSRIEFGFLHDVFEEFVSEDWKGLVRGQHRFFSASTREKSPWLPLSEATRKARTTKKRIVDLVRQGKIEGEFFTVGPVGPQCWIKRASLYRWVTTRDTELAQYMTISEVGRMLGLRDIHVRCIAQAGLIRNAPESEYGLSRRSHFFFREDVMKIKLAFEKHAMPEREYSKPGSLITLGDALKNYLSCSGLPAVIRAVNDGTLVPVADTHRFPGITRYLFPREHLRLCRPLVGEIEKLSEGFLNYREAAARMGSNTRAIRGLVENRVLCSHSECARRKFVAAVDVQNFANQYVETSVLARQFHVSTLWLRQYLRKAGIPTLATPAGLRDRPLFIHKDAAVKLQISPPTQFRR